MSNLPTIEQLQKMELTEKEKNNGLKFLLNQKPPASWIKTQQGMRHLPVDKVRFLLDKIYGNWYVEIKKVKVVANSVVVVVTLHYNDPMSDIWRKMDGIGAAPINTKSGAKALEWNDIIHDSVHKCSGAAEAFALKNAAKKLGRIFGADLMKDDVIDYSILIDKEKFENAKITER